jgi:hypothetical protein
MVSFFGMLLSSESGMNWKMKKECISGLSGKKIVITRGKSKNRSHF